MCLVFYRFRHNDKAVILGSDFNSARFQVFYGLINAMMAEFKLGCISTNSLADNLMSQADAEYRRLTDERFGGIDNVRKSRRIARPVGKQYAIGLIGKNLA